MGEHDSVTEPGGGPNATLHPDHLDALPASLPAGTDWESRYVDLGPIGAPGGGGEVVRVYDRVLAREVVAKLLPARRVAEPHLRRFLTEAQVTARLEHPAIVPVYDLGHLPDGRPFYTMKRVHGSTLAEVIDDLHRGGGRSLRRVVDAVRRAAEAVGFAHRHGLLHRDLKPANVLIGAHDEVYVIDWGLTRVLRGGLEPLRLDAPVDATADGTVMGTPAYMAPEQAHGALDRIGPATDVYGLGAILYQVLTGVAPHAGATPREVVAAVRAGPPPRPSARAPGAPMPAELEAIVLHAMARDPADRPRDGAALARALADWLDGATARERALQKVAAAQAEWAQARALRQAAAGLRTQAAAALASVRPWEGVDARQEGWALEDDAEAREAEADQRDATTVSLLTSALIDAPGLPEAHAALAGYYQQRHELAEAAGDVRAAARAFQRLVEHDRGDWRAYVDGAGTLTLHTDPPGATVEVQRYVTRDRRLVPEPVTTLGPTPLTAVPLPMGSYRLVIRAPGRAPVHYPVLLSRLRHWDGVPPGEARPRPIPLPGALDPDDVYVPAGWFDAGGDPQAHASLPATRAWVDGYVIRRHPVTQGEYLAFLNDLVARGEADRALRHAPRMPAPLPGEAPTGFLARDGDGRFHLPVEEGPGFWHPDQPVLWVDWHDARAYAAWVAARTGLPWRLPTDLEWEKAARGVDRRRFPWGDTFVGAWCCWRNSSPTRPLPVPVTAFPTDESPYGVRGLAGNLRDWCEDRFNHPDAEEDQRVQRGGSYFFFELASRAATRYGLDAEQPGNTTGFRLARSLDRAD